jgi:hypothetical protein
MESSRLFRACAESWTRSAPLTPDAPGSFDAPITLSRSLWLNGFFAGGFSPVHANPAATATTNKVFLTIPPVRIP